MGILGKMNLDKVKLDKVKLDKVKGKNGMLLPILAGGVGILLILFGGAFVSGSGGDEPASFGEAEFYTETLERKIEALCRSVSGITDAEVLLTLDSSTEYVYAQNEKGTSESSGHSTDYVIVSRGEESGAVLVMEICPRIRGIAVVCTGGDEAATKQTVTELLSAALGVPSNRIKVAGS